MTAYLLELKVINIFNTNITKVFIFKNKEEGYNFAKTMEPFIKKEIINPIEKLENSPIVWISNTNILPRYVCELKPLDNNVLWGFYMDSREPQIIHNIYKNLKINNFVS